MIGRDENAIDVWKIKENNRKCYKLMFLELYQQSIKVLGMIDSGASVNCIGSKLVEQLYIDEGEVVNDQIRGIGGNATIQGYAMITFTLPGGMHIQQLFVVMSSLQSAVILGLPFLKTVEARLDFKDGIMKTCYGDMILITGESKNGVIAIWDQAQEVLKGNDGSQNVGEIERLEIDLIEKLVHSVLSAEEKEEIKVVFRQYPNLWNNSIKGATTITKHTIELTTQRSLATKPRRFSEQQQILMEEEVKRMEQAGIIENSSSRYASEIVLVKKATGDWRVCIDYRLINQFTIDDKYPLPRIQDLLRTIRGSTYFITLDLRSGYWQIPMDNDSKEKTAFRTPRGLKQFKVMPFGLKNAPATFQRMMEELLGDLHWNGVLVYLDDVLVHGKTYIDVKNKLSIVLARLQEANLTVNFEKCNLFPQKVKYLGYILEGGTLRPNPEKVEVLERLKTPKTPKDVRSLLGLAGFYRQFIPNYAAIAEPLTRLTKKNVHFKWTQVQQEAKQQLLKGLYNQVLYNPEIHDEFKLETDASDIAVGGILSCTSKENYNSWRPVEFMSKVLNETQRRWPVHEREAYAIVVALEKFDCYLRGKTFNVFTDNSSLKWMAKATVGKIARWACRLAEYNMTIVHKSGTQMEHVDFLSRYVEPIEYGLYDRMTAWIVVENNRFPTLDQLRQAQQNELPYWGKGFAISDGIIFYRSKAYVPPTLRNIIITAGHEINPIVHPGMRKTKAMIRRVFAWPRMDDDIARYIRGCLICQRIRPGIETLQGQLKRKHDIEGAFEKIYVDIWSASYGGKLHKCLTVIDSLTRWAEVVEVQNETSDEIAIVLFKIWISRYGVPRIMVTDRGSSFTGDVFQRWCHLLGVQHIRTSPYHPQGNAFIESFHRTLNKAFMRYATMSDQQIEFGLIVALAMMGYRSIIHRAVGESPAFLAYGIDPRPAVEYDWRSLNRWEERERIRVLNEIRNDILAKANEQGEKLKLQPQQGAKLHPGDLVLLKVASSEVPEIRIEELGIKLKPKWSLPYRIVRAAKDGQTATAKNLVTFKTRKAEFRDVHISNVRIISPPIDEHQRELWSQVVLSSTTAEIRTPQERSELLKQFWGEMEQSDSNKRPRLD